MNIDISIPGYLPVKNINNSTLSNLLTGSIIKALVLEINSENMLLKLPDGSILKASADTLDNIALKNQNSNINVNGDDMLNAVKDFKSKFRAGEMLELKVIRNDSKLLLLKNMNTNPEEDYSVSKKKYIDHVNDATSNEAVESNFNYDSIGKSSSNNAFKYVDYYGIENELLSIAAKNKFLNSINSNNAAISNATISGNEISSIENNLSLSDNSRIEMNNYISILNDDTSPSQNDKSTLNNASFQNNSDQVFRDFIYSLNNKAQDNNNGNLALYKYLFAEIAEENEIFNNDSIRVNEFNEENLNNETRNIQANNKEFLNRNILKNELLNKDTLEDIVKTLNSLKKIDTTKLLNSIKTAGTEFTENENSLNIQNTNYGNKNNISGNSLNNSLLYIEIPIQYNGQKSSGKLYFIRKKPSDSKQDKKASRNEPFTACLLLEFQRMGLVQTIISLKQKSVFIDIKVEKQQIANFVKSNYSELFSGLNSIGYRLLNLKCGLLKEDINPSNIEETITTELQNNFAGIDYRI